MNFDWTIFRLLNNSVLSLGCLKDHENLWIGGGFLVFLQISRAWSHSELGYLESCDATLKITGAPHTHFPPLAWVWPCPLPLARWNFSGFKVFSYWSFGFVSQGLKMLIESALSSSSTFHCKRNSFQQTGMKDKFCLIRPVLWCILFKRVSWFYLTSTIYCYTDLARNKQSLQDCKILIICFPKVRTIPKGWKSRDKWYKENEGIVHKIR